MQKCKDASRAGSFKKKRLLQFIAFLKAASVRGRRHASQPGRRSIEESCWGIPSTRETTSTRETRSRDGTADRTLSVTSTGVLCLNSQCSLANQRLRIQDAEALPEALSLSRECSAALCLLPRHSLFYFFSLSLGSELRWLCYNTFDGQFMAMIRYFVFLTRSGTVTQDGKLCQGLT